MSNHPVIDSEYVIARLQAAALTARALPGSVGPARLSAQTYGYVAEFANDAAPHLGRVRMPEPTRKDIAEMDEALNWLPMIESIVQRRIVAMRSLVHPITLRHLYSWRAIATAVGASHQAMSNWHASGVAAIVSRLRTEARAA